MLETLLILALFAGAVFYLGRLVWQQFFSRKQAGCAKGCGSCGALDFEKIAQATQQRETVLRPDEAS